MSEKRIKYYSQKAEEVDKRVLRFIGSTEDVDRDNEVIKASGWKLASYKKNPVVLVNHRYSDLPVAKSKKVWVDRETKSLMFDIEFPDSEVSSEGDTLYKLYKNGYMNATSVGFRPNMKKAVFGEKEGEPSITFKEQELLEISLVSVPANPNALMTSKSVKQAIEDEVIDELEYNELNTYLEKFFTSEEPVEKTEEIEEVEEEIEEVKTEEKNTVINKCTGCGVELTLCPNCKEEKEKEDFFGKLYKAILDERESE